MVTEALGAGPVRGTGDADLDHIAERLQGIGLRLRGGFALDPALDRKLLKINPGARFLALVGNAGNELWQRSGPAIRTRRGPNPLNDWIKETMAPIAKETGAAIHYDFEGPPWWPFQQWAMRAEPVHPSPLGILIHPVFGLWHAYRAALVFDRVPSLEPMAGEPSPCDSCEAKPCLGTCPVGAFDGKGYDVARCASHLFGAGAACRSGGCLARLACPVGADFRYAQDQAAFHMDAFVASLRRRGRLE